MRAPHSSLDLAQQSVMFAVRIVTADYYLTSPLKDLDVIYNEFRESDVKKVPVVRIFGATPIGMFIWFLINDWSFAAWYSTATRCTDVSHLQHHKINPIQTYEISCNKETDAAT